MFAPTITLSKTEPQSPFHTPDAVQGKPILSLYRVSTDKQFYYDNQRHVDIPIQWIRCREYAAAQGWNIVAKLKTWSDKKRSASVL